MLVVRGEGPLKSVVGHDFNAGELGRNRQSLSALLAEAHTLLMSQQLTRHSPGEATARTAPFEAPWTRARLPLKQQRQR